MRTLSFFVGALSLSLIQSEFLLASGSSSSLVSGSGASMETNEGTSNVTFALLRGYLELSEDTADCWKCTKNYCRVTILIA
jgi:hypothetical protein